MGEREMFQDFGKCGFVAVPGIDLTLVDHKIHQGGRNEKLVPFQCLMSMSYEGMSAGCSYIDDKPLRFPPKNGGRV